MFAQESVMDIQKEREAFVEKYRKVYKVDKSLFVNDSGEFTDLFCQDAWVMWQAAKAQAVPEGFVLVDKHQLAQLMANMDSFGKKALGDDYVSFADIAEVLDEAQEQK